MRQRLWTKWRGKGGGGASESRLPSAAAIRGGNLAVISPRNPARRAVATVAEGRHFHITPD